MCCQTSRLDAQVQPRRAPRHDEALKLPPSVRPDPMKNSCCSNGVTVVAFLLCGVEKSETKLLLSVGSLLSFAKAPISAPMGAAMLLNPMGPVPLRRG